MTGIALLVGIFTAVGQVIGSSTLAATRALEAGARAICIAVGDDPDESTYAREMACSGNEREPQARWQY